MPSITSGKNQAALSILNVIPLVETIAATLKDPLQQNQLNFCVTSLNVHEFQNKGQWTTLPPLPVFAFSLVCCRSLLEV